MTQQTKANGIDVHAHIAPVGFLKEVQKSARAFGVEVEETPQGYAVTFPHIGKLRPTTPGLVDTAPRVPWMQAQGLGTQYLAAWLDVAGYSLPTDTAVSWSRLLNEHIAQAARQGDGQFKSLAILPIQDGQKAAAELEHAVTRLGMSGTMVPSDPLDMDLARPDLEPLWEAAEALKVPVLLHGATHSKWTKVGPSYLAFSLGRTLDTSILAAKLVLLGIFDRHPGLKLVLCHGGGFIPYQMARMEEFYHRGTGKAIELERGGPEAYLPLMYFDTVAMNAPSIRLLIDSVGSDHVMLGSDWVWDAPPDLISGEAKAAAPNPQQYADICCNTALRLFGQD